MWILIAVVLVLLLYFYHQKYTYFDRLGIPHAKPYPAYGAFFHTLTYQCAMAESIQRVYNVNRDAKYVGMFDFATPALLLRDLDLIKQVAIKNFDHFTDHYPLFHINNYKKDNLINLKGSEWQNMRKTMIGMTTSKKMRELFPLFNPIAKRTAAYLSALPPDQRVLDIWDVVNKFTCDSTASMSFGLDVDTLANRENEFYVKGHEIASLKNIMDAKVIMTRNFPRISKAFNFKLMGDEVAKMFADAMTSVMNLRDETGTARQDLLQYMMNTRENIPERRMTFDDMITNAVFTFFANSAFSGLIASACIFEAAANQEVHKRLQEEIDQVLEKCDGDVTMEAINDMKYMEAVVNEALRMYPPIPVVDRICTKRFELPPALPTAKPCVVEEGDTVFIPIFAIHRDPDYFPEPDKFNPERFYGQTAQTSRMSMTFGIGPRMCMGNRLAVLVVKTIVFHVLAVCEVKPCSKSDIPIRFSVGQILSKAAKGYWVDIQPRNKGITVV